MSELVEGLDALPEAAIYLIMALLVAGETALLPGVVLPTMSTLLFVGFLGRIGTVDVRLALIVAVAAAVAGDQYAYLTGVHRRAGLHDSRATRWVGTRQLARAEAALAHTGVRAVYLGRLITVVRTVMPRLAGAAGMPRRTFTVVNTAGIVTWAGAELLAGYAAGASYEKVASRFGQATAASALLGVTVVGLTLLGRWFGRHPEPAQALGERIADLPVARRLTRRYTRLVNAVAGRYGEPGILGLALIGALIVMTVTGFALAAVTRFTVSISGISSIDPAVTAWMADHRGQPTLRIAQVIVSVLSAAVVIVAVTIAAVVTGLRAGRGRPLNLLDLLGTAGLVIPMILIVVVAEAVQPQRPPPDEQLPTSMFPTQNAVVTAGLLLLAWLATRNAGWQARVAAWTLASIGIALVTAARLYIGWSWPSETLASVLLGILWNLVIITAWRTRDRLERTAAHPIDPAGQPHPRLTGRR